MYKNYYLFEKQVNEIKPQLLGKVVTNVFTYQKNEIVLEISDSDPIFLLINISIHMPYLLIRPVFNIRHPKYKLFQEIYDETVFDLSIKHLDKQITIEFEKFKILIVFYGTQPNVFLIDINNSIINSFKSGAMSFANSTEQGMDFRGIDLNISDFTTELPIDSYLKTNFKILNKTIINEIKFRTTHVKNTINSESLIEVLKSITKELESSSTYLYRQRDTLEKISLIRLSYLEKGEGYRFFTFDSVNEAWNRFVSEKFEKIEFDKLYKLCHNAIYKKMDFLTRSIKYAEKVKDLKERKKLAELKGNLLLTYKNQNKLDKKEVVLENIFSKDLEKIKVKVNPYKSVSENAQLYFNKFKDIDKKSIAQTVKTKTLSNELENISNISNKLKSVKNLPSLRKIQKTLSDMNLITTNLSDSASTGTTKSSFKKLILDNDWHVYIGKSGDNNDDLTFKFAKKQDYWFHAQGVPGSHVILKTKLKDQVPPYKILEQVAGIAAANSKSKHSSTVPVIYTQVRYVSRIRNAPKGTVNTRNEKTLFVEPLNIS